MKPKSVQQQPQGGADLLSGFRDGCNLFCLALLIHQRSMIVPMRSRFGVESLGPVCVLTLLLMAALALFTGDPFMWGYLVCWFALVAFRRWEAYRLVRKGERIHGLSDGWPSLAMRLPFVGQGAATLVVEPLIVLGCCVGLWCLATRLGTPPGLALWLTPGPLTLVMVEGLRGKIRSRRAQAILDARLEQEAVMRDYRTKWGNS